MMTRTAASLRRKALTPLLAGAIAFAGLVNGPSAQAAGYTAGTWVDNEYDGVTATITGDLSALTLTIVGGDRWLPRLIGAFPIDSAGRECFGGFLGGGGYSEFTYTDTTLDITNCYEGVGTTSRKVPPVYPVFYNIYFEVFYNIYFEDGGTFNYPYRQPEMQYVLATGEAPPPPVEVSSAATLVSGAAFLGKRERNAFTVTGLDTATATGQTEGLARACIRSTWTARTRFARSSTRLLWNGNLAEELDGRHGEVQRPSWSDGTAANGEYFETVTLRSCGPVSTTFRQTLLIGTPDRTLKSVTHSSEADFYTRDGRLAGTVSQDPITSSAGLKLDLNVSVERPIIYEWWK